MNQEETNLQDPSSLDREGTLQLLAEVRKVAEQSESYSFQISQLSDEIGKQEKEAEELLRLSSLSMWLLVILGIILCIFFFPVGIAIWIVAFILVYQIDGRINKKKFDEKEDAYRAEHVVPLKNEQSEIIARRNKLLNSEQGKRALDAVGMDMLYSACIDDLSDLVKSRRADNLKEALNRYDDVLYKARMEEMQAGVLSNSDTIASESIKQTDLAKKTELNSRKTAKAAKWTAINSYLGYKYQKKGYKEIKKGRKQ